MREVASHGLKRSMRGALTATAVATAVTVSSAPALADPDLPDDKSEAVEQLQKLSRQAEQLTEKYKRAKDDHEARMSELEEAKAAEAAAKESADRARAEEEKFRGQVDELTSSVYKGSRMNQLSALMASESPDSFLDRASIMDELARENQQAVSAVSSATEKAEAAERKARQARERAAKAEQEAARLQEEISKKKSKMEERVSEVEEHIEGLSQEEQDSLSGGGQTDYDYAGGSGSASGAVQAALDKQGAPYVYGATGPSQFDCSGLMYWAYAQAGVDLPRSSSAQAQTGKPISASQLKPGDLIFYYSPVSHVSMYVGDGKAVHAPTSGQVVKVVPYEQIASVNSMRRVVG